MKPLILFILLMSVSGSAWAMEDCGSYFRDSEKNPLKFRPELNDKYNNCRIANALENIAEALKK